MEPSKEILDLKIEEVVVLNELLPRFNSIYKSNILLKSARKNVTLYNIENVSLNDIFTLGGFYGTELYKYRQKEL